ncbi:uncharacterized protein LOC123011801 [Tribolium madens]|uniref:uncharacterized protein LOC123011801 n=1 Tax=Tribolium madens TaxID=41895 RepID=UPI001CF7373E|nr:uncharacterized protein LOC123011801 [Tribolium madens]
MQRPPFLLLLLFLAVFSPRDTKAEIEERFKEDFYKIYKHTAIEAKDITNEHITPDKITYFLFTKNDPENYVELDASKPEQLAKKNVPIVFIIHGWLEKREKDWYEDLKNAFLTRNKEYHVVQVDWSDPAHQLYTVSSWNTKDVGKFIGEFIVGLHKNHSVPLENILVVGHSLGGQISGFIGKKVKELTGKKLKRIVALDPAGPFFVSRPEEERLNKNDAEVVHVIHTNGGTFGFEKPCGTIDFFPNGGSSQPGCKKIDITDPKTIADPVICDHQRSWGYFIDAVKSPDDFIATRCASYDKFKSTQCEDENTSMGDLKTRKTGEFYLETNEEKPFKAKQRKEFRKNFQLCPKMKEKIFSFVILIIICLHNTKADIEDRFKEDFFKIYKHTAIEAKEITNEHVTPDKIKYFLFTKNHPENYTEIDPSSPEELAEAKVPLVFIIHGWTENREREWYEDLKNAFLTRKEDYYVVQVDWSDPADQIYTISSWNTKDVGHIIGEFIVGLHKNYSVPLENILLVGHSLGGQVSGFVGKKVQELTGNKLPRIIALDPAGPLFISRPDEERLNKNDAEVVHVIHTDGGTFGFKSSCGTIDFYPNGGNSQPGCTRIDLLDIKSVAEPITCDHHRSWQYFIEAVLNPNEFLATKCDGYTKFKTGLCEKEEVPMGDLQTKKTGDFYLETNKEKPYAKRRRGLGVGSVLSSLKVF